MNSPILISNFDSESRDQFLKSDRMVLGHREMSHIAKENTIIVLNDKTTNSVFGLVTLKNAPGSSKPCIRTHPLDHETYSGQYSQYNKFQMYTKEVKIFNKPLTHSTIKKLIHAPNVTGHGNIWTNNQMSYRSPFHNHKDVDSTVIERYKLLINTLMSL